MCHYFIDLTSNRTNTGSDIRLKLSSASHGELTDTQQVTTYSQPADMILTESSGEQKLWKPHDAAAAV